MAPDPDERYILDKKNNKRIQYIVGTFLCYTWSVDPKHLRAINEISRVQLKPTRETEEKATMLLYYTAIYPNAVICYKYIDMVLHVDSDSAYLTMLEARTFYARHFILAIGLHRGR